MNQITSNTVMIKQLNAELVKETLIEMQHGTKLTIAKETGLSVATCGNILNELLERGEVIEIETERPNGGRPAKRFTYNVNYSYIACMYLCYDNEKPEYTVNYAVLNLAGENIEDVSAPVDVIDYENIEHIVGRLIKEYPLINAVGIGVPGIVCNGVILSDCDIESLNNLQLEEKLREKYAVEVVVANDMNLKTLGFYRQQNYDEAKNIALINFPKNKCIGSGIIIAGHIVKGNTHFAGEVSYLPLGISHEEHIKQLNSKDGFMPLVIKTIVSVIAIINPDTIAITGELIDADMVEDILEGCIKIVPKEHMPEIIIRSETDDDYINGLVHVTIESLSCDVKLVRKKI